MTWADFAGNAAANTIGSLVGVVVGVPIALWVERRRLRREEIADVERRHRADELDQERLKQRYTLLGTLLVDTIDKNLAAVERAEIDVGYDRPLYRSDLDLETWDVLKPDLLPVIQNPAVVVRIAVLFAQFREFADMLSRRAQWTSGYHGFASIRDEIVKLGPQLRHHGRALVGELRTSLL